VVDIGDGFAGDLRAQPTSKQLPSKRTTNLPMQRGGASFISTRLASSKNATCHVPRETKLLVMSDFEMLYAS